MTDLAAAAASGDSLKLLIAMRERVAEACSDERCHPRDLAALTRRLQEINKEIEDVKQRQRLEGKSSEGKSGDSDEGEAEPPWDSSV